MLDPPPGLERKAGSESGLLIINLQKEKGAESALHEGRTEGSLFLSWIKAASEL